MLAATGVKITKTPLQIAAQQMRDHWYICELEWGRNRGFIHCIPGYSHHKCDKGIKLEKEYMRLIKEHLYESETWCGWCGRYKMCREYNMNGFSVTSCKSCDEDENK